MTDTENTTEARKWTSSAGPIQTKKVSRALSALRTLAKSRRVRSGVKPAPGQPEAAPGPYDISTLYSPFGPVTYQAAADELAKIGDEYGYAITRENHGDILARATLAAEKLAKEMPTVDERREYAQEQADNERRAKAALVQAAEKAEAEASHKAVMAKRPAWAAALIVAVYEEDKSDSMTDYFGTAETRIVAIGWRKGTREDFKQLRAAAANFKETAHLATAPDSAEHRENYSMGAGNYLKASGRYSTGWLVRSESLPLNVWRPIEDAIPAAAEPTPAPAAGSAQYVGCEVQQHTHTKKGFVYWLVVLKDRVERGEFERLRSAAQSMGGWYSRQWSGIPGGFAFKAQSTADEFIKTHVTGNGGGPGGGIPEEGNAAGAAPALGAPRGEIIGERVTAAVERGADATREATACELEEKAAAMEKAIASKINSGTSRQNPTPRRLRIAENMRRDGERLIKIQKALRALAAAWRANEVPTDLSTVRTKAKIEEMMWAREGAAARQWNTLQALIQKHETDGDKEADAKRKAEKELRDLENEARFSEVPGFFPTPDAVIQRMIEAAAIEPGMSVLEPSAGIGHIAFAVAAENVAGHITCIEVRSKFCDIMKRKAENLGIDFSTLSVTCDDFMNNNPPVLKASDGTSFEFSRVLMNPPFENGQDCQHVRRAFSLLKDGGRLVAIMSNSAKRTAPEFTAWLDSVGAVVEPLEEGAFKSAFRPTGVSCVMVTIDK